VELQTAGKILDLSDLPISMHPILVVPVEFEFFNGREPLYDLHVDHALLYYCHLSHRADMAIGPFVKRREFEVMPGNICVILSLALDDVFLCL